MFCKVLAVAAIAALPMIAHAQGTTSQTQDTTAMGHSQSHRDSTTMTPKTRTSTKLHDTTAMGHNMTHKDSMSMSERNYPKKMPPSRRDTASTRVSPAIAPAWEFRAHRR